MKSWIEDTLKEFNFDLSKCVNLTADGASNNQGIDNGLVKQLTEDIKLERQKKNVSDLFINDSIWCFAHKENLSLKSLCSCDSVNFIFGLIHWLVLSTTISKWRRFKSLVTVIEKYKHVYQDKIPEIPTVSVIRWGYNADVVEFIVKNYKILEDFVSFEDNRNSLISDLKKNDVCLFSSWDDFNMTDGRVQAIILGLYELLKEGRKLIDSLQEKQGFFHHKFLIVQKHIEYLFYALKNITEGKEFVTGVLHLYAAFCSNYEFDVEWTNDRLREAIRAELNVMLDKFTSLSGDLKGEKAKKVHEFTQYKQYEDEVDKENANSILYSMIKLMNNFELRNYDIPSNLPNILKTQYIALIRDMVARNIVIPIKLIDAINLVGGDNYEVLRKNVCAVLCVLPTSCSVESLFSFMKIADHPNLSDENLETNVSVTLELKAHDFEKFKA